jgi:hypothetical protein
MAFEWSISGKWIELLKQVAPGVTRPWHYVPVLARKPGALRNGAPLQGLGAAGRNGARTA